MVQVLEQQMVDEIAKIGEDRRPNEACGILLPHKVKGKQVIELPNRSKTPHDEVVMLGEDILLELEALFGEDYPIPDNFAAELTYWHTHPGGNLGPSAHDLYHRINPGKNLVISLGEQPKATWF